MTTETKLDVYKFASEWQRASSKSGFLQTTGMASTKANQVATMLRNNGVPLKKFKRGNDLLAGVSLPTLIARVKRIKVG